MSTLGKRIQELRKNAGITQQALAKKINISHPQIVRYENKGVQPPADVLSRLADVFGVSIDFLVNGDTNEKAQKTLKDAELIKQFQKIEQMPDDEKKTVEKVISALIRDFNARQAYLV
jgi:transcriptional regulator with XRE-family HTH domain